jgi:hypothetical protein
LIQSPLLNHNVQAPLPEQFHYTFLGGESQTLRHAHNDKANQLSIMRMRIPEGHFCSQNERITGKAGIKIVLGLGTFFMQE